MRGPGRTHPAASASNGAAHHRPVLPRPDARARLRPSGIGPRDISIRRPERPTPSAARPTVGGSLEVQFPIWGLPRELGLKGAVFADAGTLFGYKGRAVLRRERRLPDLRLRTGDRLRRHRRPDACISRNASRCATSTVIRSSVGASHPLELAARPDPVRLRLRPDQGGGLHQPGQRRSKIGGDRTQAFRFSGGTRF